MTDQDFEKAPDKDLPLRFEAMEFKVDRGQEPLRIDVYLVNKLEKISRSRIRSAADEGLLTVNKKKVKANYKVRPNDQVVLQVPRYHDDYVIEPEEMELDIIYEDDYLMVINKPTGLVVHPGHGNYEGTLVHGLLYHFKIRNGIKPDPDMDIERLGLVHRLDKDTTGVMVVAKTAHSAEHLSKQFADRTTKRRYIALVWGEFHEESGTITGNIGRHPRNRLQNTVFVEGEDGKHAVTHYTVLESLGYTSLIECRLETGRTHQIRVHLQHINHPVFGDPMYGGDKIVKGTVYSKYKQFVENCLTVLPRQALHAKNLGFEHPHTGEYHEYEAPLPEDFTTVLDKWRRYSGSLRDTNY
ncbi:MAG: 23S rRNA pseudouridine1911/1915/1917 synthase [Limisphaerales bacterium]|jgi:23S rRNA pseudouridine1911/1915/1917 synthase